MAAKQSTTSRGSSNKSSAHKKSGKKPLPQPTHVGNFISILIMTVCKKILHIDTAVKIGVYLCGVLIGSVFSDIFALPKSYLSDKRNIFNRLFTSYGFGWTILLLSGYIFMTSFVITCGNWKTVIRKHMFRLIVVSFWWYSLTSLFSYVDLVVGVCSLNSLTHKTECLKAGRTWLGFDISGHVFLLIHNLLTISEEVKSFKSWSYLNTLLKEEDLPVKKNLTQQDISQARISYQNLTPYIKMFILLLTFWTIFCEFMLIISVVYRFHTLTQKVAAAFLAVGCWFITYRICFDTSIPYLPDQPGQSPLNYMKVKQT